MAVPPSIDRQTFLTYLRQSGLLDEGQLTAVANNHTDVTRGKVMARLLVQDGLLTRYQAERLLCGQTSGLVFRKYRILDLIGKGGIGRVYKAEHRAMKRIVALKVLTNTTLNTDRAIELFRHEAKAIAVLKHPNIVEAFDADETSDGRHYIVLEYVDGPNLDQLVRKQGPLAIGLACDYVRQVANGLQFAHQLKMIHRDIKPANIIVQKHGQGGDGSPGLIKISDFGLARLAAHAPMSHHGMVEVRETIFARENTVMGTPDYLSPEQSRDLHQTDIRSDLYSLGCTFYFLLTGQVPFPGGTSLEKLIRHVTEKPRPIATFREDVPAEVIGIVGKLMAKQPNTRYQTPRELVEALDPFALTGPAPWLKPSSIPDLELESPTEAEAQYELFNEACLDPVTEGPSESVEDELAEMTNTLSSSQADTGEPTSLSSLMKQSRRHEPNRLGLAVIVAVAVAAGVLTLLALVGLLTGG